MIDHFVYGVPDLAEGVQFFQDQFGITAQIGGQHPHRGTWNALFSLGQGAYFELIAADPKQAVPTEPRWMGVDSITKPTLLRWAWKSENPQMDRATLLALGHALGPINAGKRQKPDGSWLQWQLSEPGNHPGVDVVPFLLDWGDSVHPSDVLRPIYPLIRLEVFHPEPATIQSYYDALRIPIQIQAAAQARLRVYLKGPNGPVALG